MPERIREIISDFDASLIFIKKIEAALERAGFVKLSGEVIMCRCRMAEIKNNLLKIKVSEEEEKKEENKNFIQDGNGYF